MKKKTGKVVQVSLTQTQGHRGHKQGHVGHSDKIGLGKKEKKVEQAFNFKAVVAPVESMFHT